VELRYLLYVLNVSCNTESLYMQYRGALSLSSLVVGVSHPGLADQIMWAVRIWDQGEMSASQKTCIFFVLRRVLNCVIVTAVMQRLGTRKNSTIYILQVFN